MNCSEYQFDEVVTLFDKQRVPLSSMERAKRQGKYRYYGAQGIIDYIDDYIFDGEYLLLAEDGENLKSNKQDLAQLVDGKFWVNNHAHILRTKGVCRLRYFYYWINSKNMAEYVTGSAQPKLSQASLKKMIIPLPSLEVQDKILSVITPIDEKIKENDRINENLLQQAQALYREMFVNTSNDQRRVCRAEEYFDIAIGKTPPRKEHQWFTTNPSDVTWVSISDMGSCGTYISRSSEQLTQEAVDKFNIRVIPSNTVLLSFKLTVGRIAITHGEMTTNEAIAHFKTDKPFINEYLYCYLKDFNYQTMGSTSSIATAVNSKIIKAMPFVVPADDEIFRFHSVVGPMFEQILNNQLENNSLAELRDSLLPRLMSGELDVSELNL